MSDVQRAMHLVRSSLDALVALEERTRILSAVLEKHRAPRTMDEIIPLCNSIAAELDAALGPSARDVFMARVKPLIAAGSRPPPAAKREKEETTKSIRVVEHLPVSVVVASRSDALLIELRTMLSMDQARVRLAGTRTSLREALRKFDPHVVIVDAGHRIAPFRDIQALLSGARGATIVWVGDNEGIPASVSGSRIARSAEGRSAICDLILSRRTNDF